MPGDKVQRCCCVATCGASEALVKAGYMMGGDSEILDGGAMCVIPCCQIVQLMDLSLMSLHIETPEKHPTAGQRPGVVYTKDGVPIQVTSVAQVRIGPPPEIGGDDTRRDEKLRYLKSAASIFGGLSRHETANVITQTLEGHQRSMIGNMFVKELLLDRSAFAEEVNRSATVDLIGMGVWITSYVIQEITDEKNYIESLGVPELESKKQGAGKDMALQQSMARIQEFGNTKDTRVKQVRAQMEIESATTKLKLTLSKNAKTVNIEKAIADQSATMTEQRIRKELVEDQQQVKMEEKRQEIRIAQAEVDRKTQDLLANVMEPANAQCFKIGKDAEAEAFEIKADADARAAQLQLEGDAMAEADKMIGEAEAGAMSRKAKAWAEYSRASFLDKIVGQLPEITKEIAFSLSSADTVTLVSNCSGGGSNQLGREVADALSTMPDAVEKIAGKEMGALLSDYLK